jgi:hypothetical protein
VRIDRPDKSPCGAEERRLTSKPQGREYAIYIILFLLSIQPENVMPRPPNKFAGGAGIRRILSTPVLIILPFITAQLIL